MVNGCGEKIQFLKKVLLCIPGYPWTWDSLGIAGMDFRAQWQHSSQQNLEFQEVVIYM